MSDPAAALSTIADALNPSGAVENLKRLSGGASQETWAFDVASPTETRRFILRRAPGGALSADDAAIGLAAEAALLNAIRGAGPFIPDVRHVFAASDPAGLGYVMARIEGETIARKILRDDAYAAARPQLARQCGEILAKIHACAVRGAVALPTTTFADQLARYEEIYRSFNSHRPVFDLAFRWLKDHAPAAPTPKLVHGDFRLGNLMIGPEGVRAVLDWELAHFGDPLEDFAWICTPSWRFGQIENPVGGFGALDDLIAGYEAAGGARVDEQALRAWRLFSPLKWGIMCLIMYRAFESGMDRSVERTAIGRRASETEIDLLLMLEAL